LDILVQTNLNLAKTHHGLDAVRFYAEGNFKELEDYCLQDVKVTKELYDFIKKNKHLMVPKKFTGELVKVNLNLKEVEIPATLF
jgi:DEAD/DEAH box helicase domain-containing protein